ncbi:hypothetical protein BMS3Bbin15_01564 [archaeon BMS3Bbin15]|nr:hypothetical protein BMS3Bbin15_01564 [archaeon BMS3Bbin15]
MRTGVAELPLHNGKAPRWLFSRMVRLSESVLDYMSYEYNQRELLLRISNPFWFQALSCALGFDWHSSGTTTTTLGALKQACKPEEHGIAFAGGKGKASMRTKEEIGNFGDIFNLPSVKIESMRRASKLATKVDNSCLQDGYQIYHHSFILTEKGEWAVVQQGMMAEKKYARRYHWLGLKTKSFIEEPHEAILCDKKEEKALDMTSRKSEEARKASIDLANDGIKRLNRIITGQRSLDEFTHPEIHFPERHGIHRVDISPAGWKALKIAGEIQPENYEELISISGLGAKTIRALALLSELLFGTEASWKDPVKYSFAHGGKDGIPYPVDTKTYDETIDVLKNALQEAKVGKGEKYKALERLKIFTDI